MPTVLIEGYKFRFYSSDIQEPPHVHVIRNENVAKIWLVPVSEIPPLQAPVLPLKQEYFVQ